VIRRFVVELSRWHRNSLQNRTHEEPVMEPILIVSYSTMLKAHPDECSVDRILEDPVYRTESLDLVRAGAAERGEFDILHTLNNLRKKSKLPRRDN
jgi:hypothetical protein